MFIIKQLKGSHFAIHSTQQFKHKIKLFNEHFATFDEVDLQAKSWDISGCYTNMPKNESIEAMGAILKMVKQDPNTDAIGENEAHVGMKSPATRAKTAKEMVNVPKFGNE